MTRCPLARLRSRTGIAALLTGLLAGGGALAAPADAAPASGRSSHTALKVWATRSHMQCPLPGRGSRLLSIDSPGEWADTIDRQDEVTALGRRVRWSRERVLVYALEAQRHAGLRLESPTRVVRLSQGVLYWPVRQRLPETAGGGHGEAGPPVSRPCVLAVIDRAFWQRIRVVPLRT
ncbi:MAG: hypothetical protein RL456_437 [Pseudomonadota bacterium]|jgi:hypothetical protein